MLDLGQGERLRFRGNVAEDALRGLAGPRVLVDLEAVASEGPGAWRPASGRVYLQVIGEPDSAPGRGDVAVFSARLRPPWGFRNPGSGGFEAYLARKGVAARAGASWPGQVCFARPGPGAPFWLRWRRRTASAIMSAVPGQSGAVLAALVLGDRSRISPQTSESFRKAGTTHLLAISGLHLGILALILVPIFRALLVRVPVLALRNPVDPLARLCALPALTAYAAISGFQTSTLRALAMTGLVVLGGGLSRPSVPLGLLLSGASVLAVGRPSVLGDPGFQLSVAALAGLFWLSPRLEAKLLGWRRPTDPLAPPPGRLRRLGRVAALGAVKVLCAGISAGLATLPLVAYHFASSSLLGLALNPLAVPVVEFFCLPVALVAAALHALWPEAAALLWATGGAGIGALIRAQDFLVPLVPALSSSLLRTPFGVLGALGLLAAAGLLLEGRRRAFAAFALAAVGMTILLLPGLVHWIQTRWDPDAHLWALDVGQGQALVLRVPGEDGPVWIVVDGGGFADSATDTGERIVVPALEALGAGRLWLVVSTHPHPDHVLGLTTVVRSARPSLLWLPSSFFGDERYGKLLEAAAETGTAIEWISGPGRRLRLGSTGLETWWVAGPRENDRSLILRLTCGGRVALLPGDVQSAGQALVLRKGISPLCDVLVVPHHGAANAVDPTFLRLARPKVALVSAGGRPGLPSDSMVSTLQSVGARVLATFQSGCLEASFGSGGVTWVPRDGLKSTGEGLPADRLPALNPDSRESPGVRVDTTGTIW